MCTFYTLTDLKNNIIVLLHVGALKPQTRVEAPNGDSTVQTGLFFTGRKLAAVEFDVSRWPGSVLTEGCLGVNVPQPLSVLPALLSLQVWRTPGAGH